MRVINREILAFAKHLDKCYVDILEVSNRIETVQENIVLADKVENGFLQFAWEMIVECVICQGEEAIEPYRDGADFYPSSSRVVFPQKKANLKVCAYIERAEELISHKIFAKGHFDFVKLVSFDGTCYFQEPPFSFVLCVDMQGTKLIFDFQSVTFTLERSESH